MTLTEDQVRKVMNVLYEDAKKEYAWRPVISVAIEDAHTKLLSRLDEITRQVNAQLANS